MTNWPHSPPHRTLLKGTYMVTAGTYQKEMHFNNAELLDFLSSTLIYLAKEYGWELQAWAVFGNHYHFIAQSPNNPENLSIFLSHLHVKTAQFVNEKENTPNRRIWWQFWDSLITYQYSYFARLNYVHQNAVKHRLVKEAEEYPWCSASWFKKTSHPPFYKTISTFKFDTLKITDDF